MHPQTERISSRRRWTAPIRSLELNWSEPVHTKIDRWLQGVERSEVDVARLMDGMPSEPGSDG